MQSWNSHKTRIDRYFHGYSGSTGRAERALRDMKVMRRRIGELLMSAGAVALLLVAILVIYDPVREDVSRRVMTKPSAELSTMLQRTRNQAEHAAAGAREQFRTHSELAVFAIAAAVLFGFMLRT